jgi:predicted membrane protein
MAIVAIVYSVRRFWRADHSKRWAYTVLGTAVIGFMIALIVVDLVRLTG